MAGLLPTDIDDPRNQGLLGAALAMLAASGPSPQRRTFGQILGGAGMQGMQQYDQARVLRQRDEENRRRNQLTDMQIQKMQQQLAEEQQVADAARSSMMDRTQMSLAGGGGPTPQNAEVLSGLPQNASAFDQQGFTNKLFGINPLLALKMQQDMRAQNKPIVLPTGDVLDPVTLKPVYQPKKEPKETPDPLSYREYQMTLANPDYRAFLEARRTPPNLVFLDIPGKGKVAVNPKTAQPVGEPLSPPQEKLFSGTEIKDLNAIRSEYEGLKRVASSFKDSYAGNMFDIFGEAENFASRNLPFVSSDRGNWWQDMQAQENVIRHGIFGASLTATEKASWEKTAVTPGMKPETIRDNLKLRQEIIDNAMARLKKVYESGGYSRRQIDELLNVGSSPEPNAPRNDGRMATEGRMPTQDEIDAELQRRMSR